MASWNDWGFTQNPFEFAALGMDDISSQLLVGRDVEIEKSLLKMDILRSGLAVEGPLGVGKTSFIHVLLYRSLQRFLDACASKKSTRGSDVKLPQLLIPVVEHMEIGRTLDISAFNRQLFRNIAQTLIHWAVIVRPNMKHYPDTDFINAWLNEETIVDITLDLKFIKTKEARNPAFDEESFQRKVRNWLSVIFPTEESGAVVCILDNLESTGGIRTAVEHIESLRDLVMEGTPGIRWVISGAEGIVRTLARSDKLRGYINREPIELSPLPVQLIPTLLAKRCELLCFPGEQTYLPFTDKEFVLMHDLYRYARGELDAAANYCQWVMERKLLDADFELPQTEEDKAQLFMRWIFEIASREYRQIRGHLQERQWRLMDTLMEWEQDLMADGDIVNDDVPTLASYEECNSTSQEEFEADVRLLCDLNLLRLDFSVTERGRRLRLTPEARMVVRFKDQIADPAVSASDDVPMGGDDTVGDNEDEDLLSYRDKLLAELKGVEEEMKKRKGHGSH